MAVFNQALDDNTACTRIIQGWDLQEASSWTTLTAYSCIRPTLVRYQRNKIKQNCGRTKKFYLIICRSNWVNSSVTAILSSEKMLLKISGHFVKFQLIISSAGNYMSRPPMRSQDFVCVSLKVVKWSSTTARVPNPKEKGD